MVSNAPRDFATIAAGMGYRVVETVGLESLGMTVLRVRIPRGQTVPGARRELAARFPGASIDANHQFGSQARKVMQRAMPWDGRKRLPVAGRALSWAKSIPGWTLRTRRYVASRLSFGPFTAKGAVRGRRSMAPPSWRCL